MTYRQCIDEETHNGSIREDMSASGWLWDKALVRTMVHRYAPETPYWWATSVRNYRQE